MKRHYQHQRRDWVVVSNDAVRFARRTQSTASWSEFRCPMKRFMRGGLLSTARLNKAAAIVAFIAAFIHAFSSLGWIPAATYASAQGLSIILCTPTGATHVVIGEDGRPVQQAPDQDQTHNQDHQCCPCGWARPLIPPANIVLLQVPAIADQAIIFAEPVELPPLSLILRPQSPRAPPTSI